MALPGVQLLRKLGSGVRPDGAQALPPRAPASDVAFGDMLGQIASGSRGGQPIELSPDVDIELSSDVLERLGAVADSIASEGVSEFVAIASGHALQVDAIGRRVVGRHEQDRDHTLMDVQALAILTGNPATDHVFGTGLHGPRPTEGEADRAGPGIATIGGAWPALSENAWRMLEQATQQK